MQCMLNHAVIKDVNTIPSTLDIHIRDNQYTIWLSKSNVNNDLQQNLSGEKRAINE